MLGMALFFGAFPVFFATPLIVSMLDLSAMDSAALIGGVLVVVEILWIISIPLLGKQGFDEVKSKAFGWLKRSEKFVGRTRHYFAVILLVACLFIDALTNLAIVGVDLFVDVAADPNATLFGMTFQQQATLYISAQILTTIGVVASMILLGGDFWERIRRAFKWQPPEERV